MPGSETRGRQRERRALLGGLSLVGARGAAIVLTLVSVPLTLPYLGAERFGVWMTISAVVALISFADLGVGNSLMTAIAEDEGRDDADAGALHTSSALAALTAVAALLAVVFAAVYPFVPWDALYNVASERAGDEAGPATAVMVGCFLASLPLTAVQKVQLGVQDGARKAFWDIVGCGVSLVGIVAVVVLGGSLPLLVGAFVGGPLVAALANSLHWFGRLRPALRPRIAHVRRRIAVQLVRLGTVYMLLQLSAMVAFFADALLIAQILGPVEVTDYSVAWRLFSVVSLTVSVALMPLWPAYAEAASRRDTDWVRATLRRSMRLVLAVTIPSSALLLAAGGPLIDLWTGGDADPPFALLAALAAWTVIGSLGVALAMFLNALKVVRLQLIVGAAMAVANVALSIALIHAVGIEGAIIGTLVSFTLIALIPLGLAVPRILRELEA